MSVLTILKFHSVVSFTGKHKISVHITDWTRLFIAHTIIL